MFPEIVMIQPRTSLTGAFIRMLPIGLLYAASKVVAGGFAVRILDVRINPPSWEKELLKAIDDKTVIVGISVMSGFSILDSLKISRYIKSKYPHIRIIWGGPHPTFSPQECLSEPCIDFIIRGYGAEPFYQLVLNLSGSKEALSLEEISGLSFRDVHGNICHNEISPEFEFIDYKEIPYKLIKDFSVYKDINGDKNTFPMYSVMGCPYRCAFCSSPKQYAKIEKKWQSYPIEEIIGHIKLVKEKYDADFIYFIDDDSFVDLKHVENIIERIESENIRLKLGFRGARVNEVARMSDEFLEKLTRAGTDAMHIGVESGSNRILSFMKKDITVDQIIAVNKKLSRHPKIRVFYNFIVGFPTETLEEIKLTRDLILQLIRDNPACLIIPLNKPRPLPGTELYTIAVNHGYIAPRTLEEWGKYDVESSDYNPEWLSEKQNRFIRMMFICMYFIDDKIFKVSSKKCLCIALLKAVSLFYKSIALFRFRRGFYRFLLEDKIYNMLKYLG
jgi:anaerobic magnesium-protoporphyrin IX monomethyl ester cyclase